MGRREDTRPEWTDTGGKQRLFTNGEVQEVKVPSDVPTCKTNLFRWLPQAVDELNKDPAGIVHCWKETDLLRAWEGVVQAEAARKVNELFPNLSKT